MIRTRLNRAPGGGTSTAHLDSHSPGGGTSTVPLDMAPADNLQEWPEYVAGYFAAVTNICVTFPINKAMFRQQLHGVRAKEAIKQLRQEGLLNLYRGILSPLAQKSATTSIMFGSFSQYTRLLKEETGLRDGKVKVVAAMLAGCTEATLCPFERVQTLMQDQGNTKTFKNTPHAFSCLWKFGFKEYYRGLTAILLRNGPCNVIFFGCRDKLRKSFSEDLKNLRMLADLYRELASAPLSALWLTQSTRPKRTCRKLVGESFGHSILCFTSFCGNEVRRTCFEVFTLITPDPSCRGVL